MSPSDNRAKARRLAARVKLKPVGFVDAPLAQIEAAVKGEGNG